MQRRGKKGTVNLRLGNLMSSKGAHVHTRAHTHNLRKKGGCGNRNGGCPEKVRSEKIVFLQRSG